MYIKSVGFQTNHVQHIINLGRMKDGRTVSISYWKEDGKIMSKIQTVGNKVVTKIRNLQTDKFEKMK